MSRKVCRCGTKADASPRVGSVSGILFCTREEALRVRKLLKYFVVCLAMMVAIVAVLGLAFRILWAPTSKVEFERPIPLIYTTTKLKPCVEPNERERALIKTAVDALAFSSEEAGFLSIGAEKILATGLYRQDRSSSQPVCDVPEQLARASELIRNSDHLRRGRIVEYGLRLIAKLPNPGQGLAKVVGASAFNQSFQQSELFSQRDIRPLARATLAGLGSPARPYADQAYAEISIDNPMGTGAAQVAVAGEHPDALRSVERLMTEKLDGVPGGQAIPWELRNRLYEMAYALAFGGAQAKEHVAPLRKLMSRKVQSWAPPFGMVELPPRQMCEVFAKIMQEPADPEFAFCSDSGPYEQ
jgi:hypothetical protein